MTLEEKVQSLTDLELCEIHSLKMQFSRRNKNGKMPNIDSVKYAKLKELYVLITRRPVNIDFESEFKVNREVNQEIIKRFKASAK